MKNNVYHTFPIVFLNTAPCEIKKLVTSRALTLTYIVLLSYVCMSKYVDGVYMSPIMIILI